MRSPPGATNQLALALYPEDGPRVRTPREHGELLHAGGKGTVAVATKTGGKWSQTVYPVEVALGLLNHHQGQEDVYLSTQRFRGARTISKLLSLGALFADIDYYSRPDLAGQDPHSILELALGTLSMSRVPEPSVAISSGRGIYLVWLHHPLPRQALPRWSACQERIQGMLALLGADPKARDAARVLRVVGTRNRTAGEPVEALTTIGKVRTFDELAERILPLTRAELHDIRIHKALRRAQKPLWTPPEGFTAATLWEARLSDLQALRELRWFGDPMPDFRDRWLFLAGVAMTWLSPPQVLHRELCALAEEVGGWTEGHTHSKMHAIWRTAHMYAADKRVEWAGIEVDPRYRFRNQTIIDWLEITPEEERRLKTLIGDEERRRRDRERKNPEMDRNQYLTRAAKRRAQARRMAAEGLRTPDIAQALGVSVHSVKSYLYRDV